MRQPFAHQAVVQMQPDADRRALGAAVTLALCGHWEHEPPCPLAPHHTEAVDSGPDVRVRVLFAAEPETEAEVRRRIGAALATGRLRGPGGVTTSWRPVSEGPSTVSREETDHARRLIRS